MVEWMFYTHLVGGSIPSRGIMTIDELHRLVHIAANSCYVRYWINWNYPQDTDFYVVSFVDVDGNNKAFPAFMYENDLPEFCDRWDLGGITHYVFRKTKS